jgi:hypothetical protein
MVNLTDMWKAAGRPFHKKPTYWRNKKQASELTEKIVKKEKGSKDTLFKTKRGLKGGTWAHWHLALAYAKYLSAEMHIWANDQIKQMMEFRKDPEKGLDTMVENRMKYFGESYEEALDWAKARLRSKESYKYFGSKIGKSGAGGSNWKYGQATNTIYQILYGYKADELKEMIANKKIDLRDYFTVQELNFISTVQDQVAEYVHARYVKGQAWEETIEDIQYAVRRLMSAILHLKDKAGLDPKLTLSALGGSA